MTVVVKLTSAVEPEGSLQSDPLANRGRLDICLLCSIETVHIPLVVLGVMKLHDLSRDVRFQCLHNICQHGISKVMEFSSHRKRMGDQEVCGLALRVERASAKGWDERKSEQGKA
jgi:hypothetical protein